MRKFCRYLFLIFISFLCLPIKAISQSNVEISKIIPPSPTAASFGNFGNYAKGTYNGVPGIDIPLLQTIAAGQNISISLSYDASGTKTGQDASWVGLGWSLNAGGGVITRTVRGADDLYSFGYHNASNMPTAAQLEQFFNTQGASDPNGFISTYLMSVRTGQADAEPDIFSFSFGSSSGRFVLDKSVNGSNILQLESSNIKIEYLNPGWRIIDGDGNKYYFNAQELSTDYFQTKDYSIDYDVLATDLLGEDINRHPIVTAWYLDSVVTSKSQKITYTYYNDFTMSVLNKSEQQISHLSTIMGGSCAPPSAFLPYYTLSRQIIEAKLPRTIQFENGIIEFYPGTRTDIKNPLGNFTGASLSYIMHKNLKGEILKRFDFFYSNFNETDWDPLNKRLKLDSVKETTDPLRIIPAHKFSYFNPNSLVPKYSKAIDHWGYYNGRIENTTLLPKASTNLPYFKSFAGGNRRPDTTLAFLQNGVLSSVVYPTGGKTQFTYELNEYTNLAGDDLYEGKDTTIYTGVNPPNSGYINRTFTLNQVTEVKFYFDYWDPNNPDYRDEFIPDYAFLKLNGDTYWTFHNAQNFPYPPYVDYIRETILLLAPGNYTLVVGEIPNSNFYTAASATFDPKIQLAQRKGGGLRIKRIQNFDDRGNQTVKRFMYNNGALSSGKLLLPVSYTSPLFITGTYDCGESFASHLFLRYSNTVNSFGFTKPGTIGYSKVTELLDENGENGRVEYFFKNEANDFLPVVSVPVQIPISNGKLDSIKTFDATNKLLKKTTYEYNYAGFPELPGIKLVTVPFSTTGFHTMTYGNYSNWMTPKKEIDIVYSGSDSVTVTRNFYYENPVHKNLTKLESTTSNGDNQTVTYKYPYDLRSGGSPNVYNAMSDRNMHNPVIEESVYRNGAFLNQKVTGFDYWKNGGWGDNTAKLILPKSVDTRQGSGSAEPRITYKGYDDKANLLSQSLAEGPGMSYQWGYNRQYPIAEVKNALSNEVYHHNFEETSDFPSGVVYDNTHVRTGQVSGLIVNNSSSENVYHSNTWLQINQNGRNRKYRYAGWVYSTGPSVELFLFMKRPGETGYLSYVDAVLTTEVNKWVYLVKEFEVPADVTQLNMRIDNNGGGSVWFDDLSICPADAQLSTYTYKPLVGITSMIDPRGQVTTYEYDSFQRLKTVRDENGKVVKDMEYHYKNQQ
ncbi:RHS repeat protein [Mucilaginibacter terrae]|uniref:YD repeat-containing protein n=1 Tax=Mucilaginibacter terrae TaxID=1955052 RepID=A0ABU3GVD8_9SPHI|nr:RHS repeat domain-containing protein [Mucilaginibacter terrae]MDT3403739.1 YD repeat-containing protein [Mucilaginibacter terrae]